MKNVLITGGAGGIGTALCKAFAREGCGVAVHYHSKKRLFDAVDDALGSLELLVNNAGIAQQKLFTDITDNDWNSMISTNLSGVFYCCQEALKRYMIPSHSGVILNISSMWGQVGASCEVHYSAAKAGVIGLTKALAKEVGLSNIRVNCIAPGVVMTDMMKDFDEETIQALKEETPLNILGTPEDIADAAVYLCSDKAKFITGQILGVNGGFII